MAEVFLKVVNMSISATWMVLIVLIVRVLLRKTPKWISILLWALVGLRLICPFSFESIFSLIPSSETVRPEIMLSPAPSIQTGVSFLDDAVNPIILQTFAPNPAASANPLQIVIPVAANLWLLGIVALVLYTAVSYFRLKLRLREATLHTENIYLSENIPAPFVFGFTKPVIYLPYNMTVSDMQHVIAHERAHIQRKDHWWKPLGFLMLSVHWFNPVMWLAYILFCRDIEMSCDEKVVRSLSPEQRADYSTALLTCSTGHRRIAPCPLAFGETGIKERIKAVLHYKKPALWVLIVAAVLCVVIAVCCLTDPITSSGIFDPYKVPVFSTKPSNLHDRSEQIKSKLDMSGNSYLRINDIGALSYSRIDDGGFYPIKMTDEEALRQAQEYLNELGLLPNDAYRTYVSRVNRSAMDLTGGEESQSETVIVDVFFYRVVNGVDVLSDEEDGILLSFDTKGIRNLSYLWRDIEISRISKDAKPISSEDAYQIYLDQWDSLHGTCCEPCDNPEILCAYVHYNGVSRPCWVIAENKMYTNAWSIDMFTGEILHG